MFMPSYQRNTGSFERDVGSRNRDQRFEPAISHDDYHSRQNNGATLPNDVARSQLPSNRELQRQMEPRVATSQFQSANHRDTGSYPSSQWQQGNVQMGLNQHRHEQVHFNISGHTGLTSTVPQPFLHQGSQLF